MRNFVARMGAGLMGALVSVAAFALPIDVDDVVTDIGAQLAPLAAVGGAILLVFVAIKAFKWARRAL